jgi:hypothetical protein
MTPFGDSHDVLVETKTGLEQIVRSWLMNFGSEKAARPGVRTTTGIVPMNSVCVSAPIGFGSRKAVPLVKPIGTGTGPADSKRREHPSDARILKRPGIYAWTTQGHLDRERKSPILTPRLKGNKSL